MSEHMGKLIRAVLRGGNTSNGVPLPDNLSNANLENADLTAADLSGANLSNASLYTATLLGTVFWNADLSRAGFTGAMLIETGFSGADLTNSFFSGTIFADVNLSVVKGLETVTHEGRSYVDINSVVLPTDERTRTHFLRGVGFSDTFIDYLPSLLTTAIQYHTLFLSYSHHDEMFAKRLHNDLQNQGVRCWFAPHDLRPGTPIVRSIEEAIHLHEKLLLILSKDAITSNWVQQEVEAALYKEVTTGQEILFPIRLDNTVLESETLWAKHLRQRHIGDFTNWQNDTAYQRAFTTLLRHLKVT